MISRRKETITRIVERTESLNQYWREVRKYKTLSAEEEKNLFAKYKSTTDKVEKEKCKEIIALSNQKIIYSKALCFTRDPELIHDYIREGSIGLLKAIEKFDLSMNCRFMTFAIDYIYREMFDYNLKYGSIVRKSNNRKVDIRLKNIREKFYNENEREATNEEIYQIFEDNYGIEIKDVSDILELNTIFIDHCNDCDSNDDNDSNLSENGEFAIATAEYNDYNDKVDDDYTHYLVSSFLDKLDERDKNIVKMAYGIGYDFPLGVDIIAKRFNITRTRVNQIIASSIKLMRN